MSAFFLIKYIINEKPAFIYRKNLIQMNDTDFNNVKKISDYVFKDMKRKQDNDVIPPLKEGFQSKMNLHLKHDRETRYKTDDGMYALTIPDSATAEQVLNGITPIVETVTGLKNNTSKYILKGKSLEIEKGSSSNFFDISLYIHETQKNDLFIHLIHLQQYKFWSLDRIYLNYQFNNVITSLDLSPYCLQGRYTKLSVYDNIVNLMKFLTQWKEIFRLIHYFTKHMKTIEKLRSKAIDISNMFVIPSWDDFLTYALCRFLYDNGIEYFSINKPTYGSWLRHSPELFVEEDFENIKKITDYAFNYLQTKNKDENVKFL